MQAIFERHQQELRDQFSRVFNKENLLQQPLSAHNLQRRVAYQLLFAIASLHRHLPLEEQRFAIEFYNRAKSVFPFDGKILVDLSEQLNDELQKCHYLVRALSCANPEPRAKENLINLFESCRKMDIENH